ncbi:MULTISPECIES: XRE family transcriptional regulator [unclassified Ensifer]|uniref:helix-turn-helix domain-containing protein n=1 Tax=unclassified Ensifer TaxID=2633371 RepID=UPI000813D386|nr:MULTISPECIES: XRE family transcriptional regulator [unclassified Ensifer]OCO99875.1 Cro/Cl family transcriptional regulator [Ensifer sp. LC13]OCP00184.1 Cro/Cl family transcriptional regulator [Ensifer sp. LC11]OCP03961.1 Cro/Cl family transcriptional regulator [Ensifer sp. LC14]OCP31076.1 Cro/Cl family transcriptional regulator [Ensifer sp. LC499]
MSNILHSQDRSDVLAHVAENLRRIRLASGLSQTALAKASGISRRMIVAVEGGDANISLSSLDSLAAAMNVGFVDLVRDPSRHSRDNIDAVTWRGQQAESEARLLASAPAASEAQMWLWSIAPGERYDAEPDPQGWHEMLLVTEGTLTLELGGDRKCYASGAFTVYSSAQTYSYVNDGDDVVRFVRNVIS